MKLFLLAAAAVIAAPGIAQTGTMTPDPQGGTQTAPPPAPMPGQPMPGQPMPDQSMQQPMPGQPMPGQSMQQPMPGRPMPGRRMRHRPMPGQPMPDQSMQQPMPGRPMPMSPQAMPDGDPAGGYQPPAPPMSGPMQPGATVRFQPAQTPDQAYPAPAPLANYPMCKPGEFDNCMQGPRSTHSRQVRGRPSR